MLGIAERKYKIISYIIIAICIVVAICWGNRKQGYFIDENYTFTISNGTQLGIAVENGKWNDTAPFLDQVISTENENFHFKTACENTANDVHPPIYYILFHFISSIFSGVYSKWIGLALNIVILIPILLVVRNITYKLSGNNTVISLISMAFYGLNPATISNTMLIRMYLLLTLWTLLFAYVHVCDLERDRLSFVKFILPAAVLGYLGFLTQYFFVVVMFFITFVYAFYLAVFCRRVKDALIYGGSMVISLSLAAITWPICKFHIFKGYRGKGAVEQLFSFSKYFERIREYTHYLNAQVFGGMLILFAGILLIGVVLIIVKYKFSLKNLPVYAKGLVHLSLASLLDYFVISQVGLLSGTASCRHMYMAYALFLLLIPTGLYGVLKILFCKTDRTEHWAVVVTSLCMVVVLISGYMQNQVLFVYEGERVATDYADSHPDAKVVVFHKDNGMYDSRIQEFVKYPKVYFASVNDYETAKDDIIAEADELLVYVSSEGVNEDDCFESVYEQNPKITKATHMWDSNNFFKAYLLN